MATRSRKVALVAFAAIPALMLADPKSGAVKPVSYGFISQDDLAKQFLNVSTDFAPNF